MNEIFEKNIEDEILEHDVISFDIFDTLLVRPYVKPTDLFKHMEKHYGMPGFAEHRINAELKAREKIQPDVTLDDIYNEIDDTFVDMKQRELDWEEMVLRPNPQMIDVYNFAKSSGKKIVIASDMYLPTDFIKKVLEKNGFSGFDRLYVSGDLGIAKENGTMYEEIIRTTDVNPNKILHIGDNQHSDFKVPKSYSIKPILIPKIFNEYMKKNVRAKKFLEAHENDVGCSILLSMLALYASKNTNDNYWQNIGYEYCGPTVYGYTKWVESEAKIHNIDNLFFVARDGYTMHKVFNMFNKDIENHYVYAPRFMSKSVQQSKETAENYRKYLHSFTKGKQCVGMIDTISSGSLTSQTLLEQVLNKKIFGFYWSVEHPNNNYEYTEFRPNNIEHYKVFTKNWNFMEFLMTSPEPPIKNLNADGEPVYGEKISKYEQIRCKIYPFVSDSAVNFVIDLINIFDDICVYFTESLIIDWINCFCDFPTKIDIKKMAKVKHAYDAEHSKYIPLFCVDTFHFILNPGKYKYVVWLTKFQRFVVKLLRK